MNNPQERKKFDMDMLGIMLEGMSYSLPFTTKDMEQVFYLGQKLALMKLDVMAIAIPTNGVCQPIITLDILKKLTEEVENDAKQAASQSTARGYAEGIDTKES